MAKRHNLILRILCEFFWPGCSVSGDPLGFREILIIHILKYFLVDVSHPIVDNIYPSTQISPTAWASPQRINNICFPFPESFALFEIWRLLVGLWIRAYCIQEISFPVVAFDRRAERRHHLYTEIIGLDS